MSKKAGDSNMAKDAPKQFKSLMDSFIDTLQQDPQIAAAFVVGAITLLIIFTVLLIARKSKKRRAVLIFGPCDAGKTVLFSHLIHNTKVDTYTSMQENEAKYCPPGDTGKKPVNLFDLPGHERLRSKDLDKHKDSARAIIYVIDSATITKNIRDATEYLFRLLSDPVIHANKPPFMIVCNKQDLALAKSASVIERELAKEIGLLRETHSKTLEGTDGTVAIDHVFLGKVGKDFAFSDLKAKVDFCELSTKENTGFEHLKQWLVNVA